MPSIEMDSSLWVRVAFIILALQLVYFGRVNSRNESGDDWEIVMTLDRADGKSFKAIVQPLVNMTANSYRYPEVIPIQGWTLVDAVAPIHGGMHATLYKENGDSKRMVVSFRGTDLSGNEASKADVCELIVTWPSMFGGDPTAEDCSVFSSDTLNYYKQAVDYTEKVMRTYPDSPLLLTGHSLGASLALLVTATMDINPSLPVVAFSAAGVKNVFERNSLMLSADKARRVFIISQMWDEIMRATWADQVGTTCLYPTEQINTCTVCFDEMNVTSTWVMEHPPSRLQNSISGKEHEYSEDGELKFSRLPGFTDACWMCFVKTHVLNRVMNVVALELKPVCEFHVAEPLKNSVWIQATV